MADGAPAANAHILVLEALRHLLASAGIASPKPESQSLPMKAP